MISLALTVFDEVAKGVMISMPQSRAPGSRLMPRNGSVGIVVSACFSLVPVVGS